MKVGTICARNYLPSVLLLASSLRTVHPEWSTSVLLIDIEPDDKARYQQDYPEVEWLAPEDLSWSSQALSAMKLYYNVMELATALKPALLQQLLGHDDVAMYLDPDIEVFNSLSDLEVMAKEHEIVLLPHVTRPVPRDGLDPKEETFLLSGQFNLGFVAVSDAATRFLSYWNERLEFFSKIEHANGYFTDQRWVDAVPSLFEHVVVRDPGYNVAYWNLHEHELTYGPSGDDDPDVLVGGEPLRFFHYSGHSSDEPLTLSKFAPNPRVDVRRDPILGEILSRRAERMGSMEIPSVPYRWNRLPDGRLIAPEARRGYWLEAFEVREQGGERLPSPFDPDHGTRFDQWTDEVLANGLPRLAQLFWRGSTELSENLEQGSVSTVAASLLSNQGLLMMARPSVLKALAAAAGRTVPVKPGFNLIETTHAGPSSAEHVLGLLRSAGYPVWARRPTEPLAQGSIARDDPYCIEVVVTRAQGMEVPDPDRSEPLRRPSVALWSSDLPGLDPADHERLERFDEIWCASEFERSVLLAAGVTSPIFVLPRRVAAHGRTHLERVDLGLDADSFLVGTVLSSTQEAARCNVDGVIGAFRSAFGSQDRACLLIMVPPGTPVEQLNVGGAELDRGDVRIVESGGACSSAQWIQHLDVLVSLDRSAGVPADVAEAGAAGVPVIATGWSGLRELAGSRVSLVGFTLCEVGENDLGCPPAARWAEPDLDEASALLRSAKAARGDGSSAERAGVDVGVLAAAAATDWVIDRFNSLMEVNAWKR